MKTAKKVAYFTFAALTIAVFVMTLLSLFTNTPSRYLKMLDFPRIQMWIFAFLSILVFEFFFKKYERKDKYFMMMNILTLIIQSNYLINYSPLVTKAVPQAETVENAFTLKTLIYNLYIDNTKYEEAIDLLKKSNADIILALETTEVWSEKLNALKELYPYRVETVNEVGYGMTILSRLDMQNVEKNYLNNENVPSYSFSIQPQGMEKIQVYTLHPPPPNYFEDMPDNEGDKEVALKIIGRKIEQHHHPSIVMGDLNDVAWGRTSDLMNAGGRLYDVRVGRGLYNTFSAHSLLMRWPLDHMMVTKEFSVREMKTMQNAGSDHYPLFVSLQYHNQ